jgi:hypothetical protein
MPCSSPTPAGWYLTLQPRGIGRLERVTLYLFWVPEGSPFTYDADGSATPLSHDAHEWEWHGPFASQRGAQLVDVARHTPVPFESGAAV